jgi:hypothetical protein
MRTYTLILGILLIFSLISCKNKNNKTGGEYNINNSASGNGSESGGIPTIDFAEVEYNFGTVIQGEKLSHTFIFTNNGKGNLIVANVKASCGCTVPKWTQEPIKPGQTGTVELVFDSANREGKQTKSAKVYSNAEPNITELTIRSEIVTK